MLGQPALAVSITRFHAICRRPALGDLGAEGDGPQLRDKTGRLGGTFSKGAIGVESAIENPYRQNSSRITLGNTCCTVALHGVWS